MDVRKEYSNGELTVVWKPGLCFHSKECVKGLPAVFNPKEKPWIKVDAATTADLMQTIDKCPSGALSYYKNSEGRPQETGGESSEGVKVEVMANGPLLVSGSLEVTHSDGKKETRNRNTAFCRCGKTGNSPYCDGSHKN